MGNRPTATEIAHLAHHAASEASLWSEVARLLGLRLDAASIGFVEHNFLTRQGQISHGAGFDRDVTEAYAARYAAQNAWLRGEFAYAASQAMTGAELVPNWELVRTDFYKSWLRPQKLFHCLLGVMVRRAEDTRCVLALRPLDAPAFSNDDKRVLAALLPQLGCAMELQDHVAGAASRAAVLADVLSCLPQAVFVVDGDARPIWANAVAQMLLKSGDGIRLSAGMMAASSAQETTELRRLIARTVMQDGGGKAAQDIALSRPSGDMPLVLTLSALEHGAIEPTGKARAVAVAVASAGPRQPAIASGRLFDFYHMTPAEARLAAMIVDGRTLIEAAGELRITKNTARTHMKRIYAKTVTHRQADLVRLLTAGFVELH